MFDELRLTMVRGVGPRLRAALLEHFGSVEAVLAAPIAELAQVPGIGRKLSAAIREAPSVADVREEIECCRQHGIELVTESHVDYPQRLREIIDPPGLLFVRGRLLGQDGMAVAIVGSRHATTYGLEQAERLARSLARAGLTIVSGLARGIDAAAHRGALAVGGRTLAVLGSGLASIYPPEHRRLADEVAASGALVSELAPRVEAMGSTFPQRNRLISGLSLGVIVVEAALRSGALITARHAMEQGREVLAVPGRIDNRLARGCHRLLRDGAKLVESVDDVLEELGPLASPAPDGEGRPIERPAELQLNEVERRVLAAIAREPTLIDQVVDAVGLPTSQVLSTISALEIRHLVRRTGGAWIQRR